LAIDLRGEIIYNGKREIFHPCLRDRRRSGEINGLESILVITKAADDKLAAFFIRAMMKPNQLMG
jgi:hypothetical protein